jgi:hypothetical protein
MAHIRSVITGAVAFVCFGNEGVATGLRLHLYLERMN